MKTKVLLIQTVVSFPTGLVGVVGDCGSDEGDIIKSNWGCDSERIFIGIKEPLDLFTENVFGGNGGGILCAAIVGAVVVYDSVKYATDVALLLRLPKFILSKMADEDVLL